MKTVEDSLRVFDAVALLIDGQRDIDQRIHDALAKRVRPDRLHVTVESFDDGIRYPPQHLRRVRLADGYDEVEFQVTVEDFLSDQEKYIDRVAERMVAVFARERYLIKR